MAIRKIKLTIQYDGSRYSGWQIQPGKRTIQGELVDALSNLVGVRTYVHGASRTDAGVSALGQVGLFEIDSPIPTENFAGAINDRLPPEIVVTSAEEVPSEFDLLGGVKSKLYRYTIYTGRYRPVLRLNQCWHIPKKLDAGAMNQAAQLLVGTNDFKSFASAADRRESSVRTIFHSDVTAEDKWIYVNVEGDGFLYNMVRNVVGTLVEIGMGRWTPDKIDEILEAKDRTAAGRLAPPEGLCLMWIKY
ncbi:MAG: tRNA pseudouridine(38-40) synthase TruA [Sedimentisphaerales bacterium]|nr:tRNA pseudouridine(38-40) synthase TruA [Sedimentisphaerales bacterium]